MVKHKQQNRALKLLKEYRAALWRKAALEVIPGTNNKSLSVCIEQIQLTKDLVETLKSDVQLGEKMIWILHATFMTDKQPGDIEEILTAIAVRHRRIPRRTYFRLKKQAIERLNDYLEEKTLKRYAGKKAT